MQNISSDGERPPDFSSEGVFFLVRVRGEVPRSATNVLHCIFSHGTLHLLSYHSLRPLLPIPSAPTVLLCAVMPASQAYASELEDAAGSSCAYVPISAIELAGHNNMA